MRSIFFHRHAETFGHFVRRLSACGVVTICKHSPPSRYCESDSKEHCDRDSERERLSNENRKEIQ